MRSVLLAALLVVAWTRGATAADQKKLAVLQYSVSDGLRIDRQVFATSIQNAALKAVPSLFVMTQANILEIVRQQGKTLEQCEGQCAVETGRLLGADFIVVGRITRPGKKMRLSTQLYDSQTGRLLSGEDLDAPDEDELLERSVESAARLFAPLASRVSRAGNRAPAPSVEPRRDEQGAQPDFGSGEEVVVVKIDSEPSGAVVSLDGTLLCQATPCSRALALGAHEFDFQKEGYDGDTQRLQVKQGIVINGSLKRVVASLVVQSEPPGLGVSLDGEKATPTPTLRRNLAPGEHDVSISDPCWLRTGERVDLKRGEDRTVLLVGKLRLAGLKITAEDGKGDAIEAEAIIDGKHAGQIPGAFTLSACARTLRAVSGLLGADQPLQLTEGITTSLKIILAPVRPALTPQEQCRAAQATQVKVAGWGTIGAATLGVLSMVGAVLVKNDLNSRPSGDAGVESGISLGEKLNAVGLVSLGAATVALAAYALLPVGSCGGRSP